MTKGTKITLAIFAVLMLVLVLYYGFPTDSPTGNEPLANSGSSSSPSAGQEVASRGNAQPANPSRGAGNSMPDAAGARTPETAGDGSGRSRRTSEAGRSSEPPRTASGIQPERDGSILSPPPGGPLGPDLSELTSPAPTSATPPTEAPKGDAAAPDSLGKHNEPVGGSTGNPVTPPDSASGRPGTSGTGSPIQPSATPTDAPPSRPNNPAASPEAGSTGKRSNQTSFVEYTVTSDDTMSSIAEDWFGDRNKWRFIAQANPLTDPDRLQVGQKLRLPPKDYKPEDDRAPAAKSAEVPANVHVVQSGDTLRKIARSRYGDAGKWQLIYDANRKAIGDDPGALKVGQRLTIPPAPAAKKPA